ncbi:MFS transporter [Streptomyces caniferus]|uniref:MFS transporter n=1 Tax=Streptomyces caniferus TaxID=285557 RepID=UPI002E2E8249|nr:MFS transporter [Streptomyces caniferus]
MSTLSALRGRLPAGWLCALTLCAFALQTDDFVITGVLPALARELTVGQAAAGQLVTVFSVICAAVAPVAAVVTARLPRRRLLTAALTLFCLANFAVLVTRSYGALMVLRVLAALAATVALPTVLAVTAHLAPPERRGSSLATVMAGLTGAVVIGVPAGTWTGAALGWRAAFALGGTLGPGALLLVRAADPRAHQQRGLPGRLAGRRPRRPAARLARARRTAGGGGLLRARRAAALRHGRAPARNPPLRDGRSDRLTAVRPGPAGGLQDGQGTSHGRPKR